jgi:GDPmannose 4,6-dehydratase
MAKRALITGAAGQDGAYLSQLLLKEGYEVHGVDRPDRPPDTSRLEYLGIQDGIQFHHFDLLDYDSITAALNKIQPDELYNLAAQSSVNASFIDPLQTAESSGLSTLKILEAIRQLNPKIRFYQASSSELFGEVRTIPQNEDTPFNPKSPYASAKLFAHCSTINYREAFGLFASAGILFNHESPLRGLQFVTRKITNGLSRIKHGLQDKLLLGNLNVRRDWGYAADYVQAMWLMLQEDEPDDYVIASGENHTIREFAELAAECLGMEIEWSGQGINEKGRDRKCGKTIIEVSDKFFRPTEIDNIVGDASKAIRSLGWKPTLGFKEMIGMLVDAELERIC